MDKKDMLSIACAVVTAGCSIASLWCAFKDYDTNAKNNERIQQLEDTVKWMVQSDLDLQKEPDQSKH